MAKNKDLIPEEPRRIYGRRNGRPLNPSRKDALDRLLPALKVNPERNLVSGKISPKDLFDTDINDVHVEIGFGDGEHLAGRIQQNPKIGFIGAEPYINGMAAFLKNVNDNQIDQNRIRVWMDDAISLLQNFKTNSLSRIYVLNPDPWPKLRHHKRRIINQDNLDLFSELLKKGGQLIMTTDVNDLAEWMITQANHHTSFSWTAKEPKHWQTAPEDWITTRYESKGKDAGRHQTYLIFERN